MVLASSGTHSDNDTLVTSAKSLVTNGIERLLPDHAVAQSDLCGTIHKGHQVLRWRLASAAVIISVSCFLMWADFKMGEETGRAGLILTPIAVLVAMAGANEVRTLIESKGHKLRPFCAEIGSGFATLMACVPLFWLDYPVDCPIGRLGWILYGILGAIGGFFLVEILRFNEAERIVERVAFQSFAVVYFGGLLGFLAVIRDWHDNNWGLIAVISVISVVKLSDAGAYFVGRAVGRHKMAPKLSPGKTWEGAAGALVVGSLGGWVSLEILQAIVNGPTGAIAIHECLLYGLVLSVAGMIGDLVESLLKRDAAVKDSSRWLPGLGGILDVFDSLLVAAGVAYVCWSGGLITLPG